ncbi:hypothetical protein [Streptomyces sp. NPDC090036]|uniref:hypothetical protein n=1 Tax=Streptomyces sp. NPDC090036 TaxID=3365926 RepID=UPI0037F5C761
MNVLPVRLPVRGADTFRSLLHAAAGEPTLLRRHQRLRGEELARELWPEYGAAASPGRWPICGRSRRTWTSAGSAAGP